LSGATNNALDQEYVLDLKKWKWFRIDRGTGKRLQCGVTVLDTPGNQYSYGFLDTGYMERLEDGTDFDGNDITCTLQVGDQLPVPQDLFAMTRTVRANLITMAKNTDSDIILTHLIDGAETGTSYTMSAADASHRYANDVEDIYSPPGIFHSFKLSTTSDNETKGFEPIYLAITYQKEREHTQ
jgi:alpha-tubulin suppressor-like RCC1 family protein